jgi:8-oxo-dGTP diphosphatase
LKLIPVALAVFYRQQEKTLHVWTQVREDDGIFHGLLEFPGGGIEQGETPLEASVREVEEEVGIVIGPQDGKFFGTYTREIPGKMILLNVFLFPEQSGLLNKGHWLTITKESLSSPYAGKIPEPNHQIIDDLYRSLYSVRP